MTTGTLCDSHAPFILIIPSIRCIQVIAGVLGRAGEAGQKKRLEAAARGEITYRPAQGLVLPGEEDSAAIKEPTVKQADIDQILGMARKQDEGDELDEKLDMARNRESDGRDI